jgi:hypothetical protein
MLLIGILFAIAILILLKIYYTINSRQERMAGDSPALLMLKDYGPPLMSLVRRHQAYKYKGAGAQRAMRAAKRNNLRDIDTMDGKILLLLARYNPDTVYEVTRGADGSTSTTYDKGASMDMCLRGIDGVVHDDNLLKFVFTHELAHIMTHENDHPDVFWMNFKFLLEIAVENKLYIPYDFMNKPVQYCGMNVNHSPLFDATIPSIFRQYVTTKCGGSYNSCGTLSDNTYI